MCSRSTANLSKEQCCEVLKNNLQTLFNLKIHQTLETFKKASLLLVR